MSNIPTRPITDYPEVAPEERPPVPPVMPGEAPSSAARSKAPPSPPPQLDFLDPVRRSRAISLAHPFRLDGREIAEVVVRRPLTWEVAAWRQQAPEDGADTFELYAVMTGLPAEIIRAMDADDGAEIAGAAYDFLPRWVRGDGA